MLAKEKAAAALAAIEACCGRCTYCSPDCPVAIARRAMRGLYDDLVTAEEQAAEGGAPQTPPSAER